MSCYYPVLALDLGVKADGKHLIKFLPQRADYNINALREKYADSLLLLPCGKCLGCKFDKASDWAVRSVLEASLHKDNCFITLTYNEANMPQKVLKKHATEFIKKLRNRGVACRYLLCGEYGSRTKRPHYHAILFGYCPDDLVFYKKSGENNLYTSDFLSDIWSFGFVIVGDVSYESAGYVARYTTKKIGDSDAFITMSNRPGLAFNYLTPENMRSMLETGFVYGNFGKAQKLSIPRYFHQFLEKFDKKAYDKLKANMLDGVRLKDDTALYYTRFGHLEKLKDYQAENLNKKLTIFDRGIYD